VDKPASDCPVKRPALLVVARSQQIHPPERCAGERVADEDTAQNIALNAGLNVLVFKVVNEAFAWQGSIRFTDSQGNPLRGIKVSLTP